MTKKKSCGIKDIVVTDPGAVGNNLQEKTLPSSNCRVCNGLSEQRLYGSDQALNYQTGNKNSCLKFS